MLAGIGCVAAPEASRNNGRASGQTIRKPLNMKTLILTATVVCLAIAAACYFGRYSQPKSATDSAVVTAVDIPADSPSPPPPPRAAVRLEAHPGLEPAAVTTPAEPPSAATQAPSTTVPAPATLSPLVAQAIANLVSPQAAFAQKQAAWQQLRDSGKLDQAITHLEQQVTANPKAAEYPATLGQAYLQKAGTIQDLREQGILGMKADQNFEAALALDPSNWEARFWRATAMSYWPPELNKTQEVIENFLELVKLQEAQAQQPQFAQTYVLLGEQYQKNGYAEYATQVWQRGAQLFPGDPRLRDKLTNPAPAVQAQAR